MTPPLIISASPLLTPLRLGSCRHYDFIRHDVIECDFILFQFWYEEYVRQQMLIKRGLMRMMKAKLAA